MPYETLDLIFVFLSDRAHAGPVRDPRESG